jgi:hypothetical protein
MDFDCSFLKLYPLQALAPNSHAHAKRYSLERARTREFDCDEHRQNSSFQVTGERTSADRKMEGICPVLQEVYASRLI